MKGERNGFYNVNLDDFETKEDTEKDGMRM
jgi:hypothetical protein